MQTGTTDAITQWVTAGCARSPLLTATGLAWPSSRWQRLPGAELWMKRDDELSFSISGPKFRKLLSLGSEAGLPKRWVSWGSSRSAFLLGLAQLCQEQGVALELFLLRSRPYQSSGTDRLYANAFAAHRVCWLEREEWPEVGARAEALCRQDPGTRLLPEGGACQETLAGAMSLALDIVGQMGRLAISLKELWIDAGSGFTAQALILGLGTLLADPPKVHVVLCAGIEEVFREGLNLRAREAAAALPLAWQMAPYVCHRPPTAASYGATNRAVWQKIAEYHQRYGILLDPIYTAKTMLSYEYERGQSRDGDPGPTLIIHSGGGLNVFGFREGLEIYAAPATGPAPIP